MSKHNLVLFVLILNQFVSIYSLSILDYSHDKGEPLSILAGSLSSRRGIIPYGYTRLNICQPQRLVKAEDTLGEILTGEVLYTTDYIANTNEDQFCQILCYNTFEEKTVNLIKRLIRSRYFTNWIVDKLPAGLLLFNKESRQTSLKYFNGIPLGYVQNGVFYIYNHYQFHILLNKIDDDKFNVVGFNIMPISIKHNKEQEVCAKDEKSVLQNLEKEPQPLVEGNILFTYDVVFEHSDITLASRWDHYKTTRAGIHWAGIIISEVLIVIISAIIVIVLCRNVSVDISNYNYRVSQLEEINEYDWKQIAGDVFRAPSVNVALLSSMLGTGTQLFLMVVATLFFGIFGFMNPEQRSNILNIGILFFCFMGLPGGYIAALFYRFWGGKSWIKVSLLTSFVFPGILIFGYIIVNIILTIEKSNASVHFSDIISLFVLWIFCTLPLILIGSFFGYKSRKINVPCEINRIPSSVPEKPCYLHYKYITFLTGFIGFATIFIEFNYVMSALWRHQIYFVATFMWISFLLFVIVVGEMSILFVFLNLCRGDFNWAWKSFIMGSSPVIYIVIYSVFYFFYLRVTRLSSMIVYFGMMGLISAMVLFICGTIAVLFNFVFLKIIYGKIRKD
jgi:transmembrane 9 superfamily protein 2/4